MKSWVWSKVTVGWGNEKSIVDGSVVLKCSMNASVNSWNANDDLGARYPVKRALSSRQ
ncbi:Uncharacterised protein [Mycobacterium tuberculosis]|nr:Uncharacterised protein [Mycobacterium tuberculosis]